MLNKGALALLSNYGGDSSDDDKRFERLPVPDVLLNSKVSMIKHIDEPTLHDGRIRSFVHERGNWATYVYIPFEEHEGIKELILMIYNKVPRNIELKKAEDFHISLTRTVILKHHWISSFVDSIKLNISHFKKNPIDPSFHMSIAWCVGDFERELNLVLPQLNDVLQELMDNYSQENWYIYVEYVLCKTGNKHFQLYLK
ncbi:hypothetical protein NQ314_019615 [Rhamnusium bicolor]|uniref:U6 snRNA phosphodiesterase 1 n=1 Tax=Rhamnusium bicolor TaxID=1586634 RepID=A0AAV8WN26_9CUCU|nr:hypothetical protein NQ314_019615 [Rhamnusium bicolor]